MSCTCRVTPLKIFVQGLSQVHKLEASPSLVRLPIRTRSALQQNSFAFARQARSLHFSKNLSQDASGAASKETEAVDDNSSKDQEETQEVPQVREEPSLATVEAPDTWKAIPSITEKNIKRRGKKPENEGRAAYGSGENKFNASGASKATEPKRPRLKGPSSNQPQPGAAYWKVQKAALKEKFPEGWRPRKRLSPDALAGIRALNAQFPDVYTTQALAEKFEVAPEAIRRILKSKWQPNSAEEESRQERWFRRGKDVWESRAALGIKPPQKWRREGIVRDPSYHDWKKEAVQRNKIQAEQDDREINRAYTPRVKRTSASEDTQTSRIARERKGGTYTPRSGGGEH
ncbi:required for respiratory growth mitochondrial [Fusarium longipes]|uniref:Required for respiratory growth protein 9, mitochondrial n=1 Tax=Fusarium longipes TaxID=694270 RepID=A0A395S6Y4_9HYPO|nr:required for respiratory growth mitochondrial [Fusarium longipes]